MSAHIYYNGFDVGYVDAHGIFVPMPGVTVAVALVGSGSIGNVVSDGLGQIPAADVTDEFGLSTPQDVLEFSISGYPGTIRRRLSEEPEKDEYNCNIALIAEVLTAGEVKSPLNEVWVHNQTYPDLPDEFVGLAATDALTVLPYVAKNPGTLEVYVNPVLETGERRHLRYQDGPSTTATAAASGFGVESVALSMPSIFSVSGSPGAGVVALGVTLANQNANKVFAGPTAGGAAAPTFRSLVAADIPSLSSVYQPLDPDLTAIAGLTPTTDNFIVSVSSAWASRTPAQVRTTLGLVVGTNVQAWDTELDSIAGLGVAANDMIYGSAANTYSKLSLAANTFPARASTGNVAAKAISDVALTLLSQTSQANMRVTGLGLGTMATQNANGVAITGGSISSSSVVISGNVQIQSCDLMSNAFGGSRSGGNANYFANAALCIMDASSGVWAMTIKPGSTFTDDRTLTITTGDADRTLTIGASASVSGLNTGDQTITLTSDVTGSGSGSFAATIAAGAVSLAKMATLAANSIIGNNTGSAATPIALTASQVRTLLGLVIGTNVQAWDTELDSIAGLGVVQGDIIYGSAANTYSKLAKGASNRVLTSNGASNNPAWGLVDLTTMVTGINPIATGGTNASSFGTPNGLVYFDGTRLVTDTDLTFNGTTLTVANPIVGTIAGGTVGNQIALVAHAIAGSTTANNVTTTGVDTTGATLLVLAVAHSQGVALTISDSLGNTWVAGTAYSIAGGNAVRMYTCKNPTVGAAHTFTVTSTGGAPSIAAAAFSMTNTASNPDQAGGATATATTSVSPGSLTPLLNDELIVTGMSNGTTTGTISINSGFAITDSNLTVGGQHYGVGLAYKVQQLKLAVNPTWTDTTSGNLAAAMMTFKHS